MRSILIILLILAILCSLGLLTYNANVFEVAGGVPQFLENVGNSVKSLLNQLGFVRGNYYILYTYTKDNSRYGFVVPFSGRLYKSNFGLVSPTGYENKILEVDYTGPYPFFVPFSYVKFNNFNYLYGYVDNSGGTPVFENGNGVFAEYQYQFVFRDNYDTACSDLDNWLLNGVQPDIQNFN